jgi:transposase-like protein
VLIIISDDFSGLTEAVKALYPLTEYQLCYVHLQRNVRRQMTKKDASAFNKELANIKLSAEHYLCFLRYPDDIRGHIYTTNAVESLHSKIELTRYCNCLT